jgi:hypothetical protein
MEIAQRLSDLTVVLVFFAIATAPRLISVYFVIREGT